MREQRGGGGGRGSQLGSIAPQHSFTSHSLCTAGAPRAVTRRLATAATVSREEGEGRRGSGAGKGGRWRRGAHRRARVSEDGTAWGGGGAASAAHSGVSVTPLRAHSSASSS